MLRLTDVDYNEDGLFGILTDFGSAYDANIRVFNDVQHTITGWPGGKPNADDSNRPERAKPFPKRILIFSPHPADDVISMGGTLMRLVKHGREVHIAYQTSGNISVYDDEALRYADLLSGYLEAEKSTRKSLNLNDQIKKVMLEKRPGDTDSEALLKLKTDIQKA